MLFAGLWPMWWAFRATTSSCSPHSIPHSMCSTLWFLSGLWSKLSNLCVRCSPTRTQKKISLAWNTSQPACSLPPNFRSLKRVRKLHWWVSDAWEPLNLWWVCTASRRKKSSTPSSIRWRNTRASPTIWSMRLRTTSRRWAKAAFPMSRSAKFSVCSVRLTTLRVSATAVTTWLARFRASAPSVRLTLPTSRASTSPKWRNWCSHRWSRWWPRCRSLKARDTTSRQVMK